MKFLRIFPEMWARTTWPFGNSTRNMVPGNTCVTVPTTWIGSSFVDMQKQSLPRHWILRGAGRHLGNRDARGKGHF